MVKSFSDDQDLIVAVKENVERYFPGFGPSRLVAARISGPSSFQNSRVYRIRLRGDAKEIIVKVLKGPASQAQSQYDALQRVWPQFSERHADLCVPRPLDYFPKFNALVMEAAPGKKLERLILQTKWPIGKKGKKLSLVQGVRRAARWLRTFHELGRGGNSESMSDQLILQKVQRQLDQCQRILARELREGISKAVQAGLTAIDSKLETFTRLHGDFKIDNILVSDHKLTVIDFGTKASGIIYYDVASFCNSIDLIRFDPRNCLISRRFLEELTEIFLSEYFAHKPWNIRILCLFQMIGMVQKCLYFANRYGHEKLKVKYLKRFFTRRFDRFLRLRT